MSQILNPSLPLLFLYIGISTLALFFAIVFIAMPSKNDKAKLKLLLVKHQDKFFSHFGHQFQILRSGDLFRKGTYLIRQPIGGTQAEVVVDGLFVQSDLTILNSNGQYQHVLVNTSVDGKRDLFLVTDLDELRVRQLLFTHPEEYLAAFGESPDRKQLAQLMEGSKK